MKSKIFKSLFFTFLYLTVSIGNSSLLKANNALEIKDWFALGSGCKGRKGGIGDVEIKIKQDPKNKLDYFVEFDLNSYELLGSKAISDKPSFARECALRIAAYPGKSHKISNISLKSSIRVDKEKGADAKVVAQLITAKGILEKWTKVFHSKDLIKNELHHINLQASKKTHSIISKIPCERPKIIGANFRFVNEKKSFKPKVQIKTSKKSKAVFKISLEKCINNTLAAD